MPVTYKELHGEGDYTFEQTEAGITGTRTFIQSTNGAVETLPTIGSAMVNPAGTTVAACTCRAIRSVFKDGHGDSALIQFSYSTAAGTPSGGSRVARNAADRQFYGGSEVLSITGTGCVWYGTSDPCNTAVFKRSASGTFTVPKIGMTVAEKDTWFSTHFLPKVGKINASAFQGFRAGSVLFESINGGNATDEAGVEVWNFTLNFNWLLRQDGSISADDWQYILDPDTGTFKKPSMGGALLYQTADLSALIA